MLEGDTLFIICLAIGALTICAGFAWYLPIYSDQIQEERETDYSECVKEAKAGKLKPHQISIEWALHDCKDYSS